MSFDSTRADLLSAAASIARFRAESTPTRLVHGVDCPVATGAVKDQPCGLVLNFLAPGAYIHPSGRWPLSAILSVPKCAASHNLPYANKGGRMNACRTRSLGFVLVVLTSIGIWGCAAKPFDPPQTGEIPKGPGVFSKGDDGVVLYDSNKKRSERRTAASQEPEAMGGAGQPAPPSSASDYAEFEAYRQFKAWKASAVGTKEYEEFQQWRQWQQYRRWKQDQ